MKDQTLIANRLEAYKPKLKERTKHLFAENMSKEDFDRAIFAAYQIGFWDSFDGKHCTSQL